VVNTAQQRRDILLAELAALGYPQPAVAPAAPVGLDWQLAQARASEVAVKVAHAAQVKANEAEILQLRLNIATREQKLAEDAAAASARPLASVAVALKRRYGFGVACRHHFALDFSACPAHLNLNRTCALQPVPSGRAQSAERGEVPI
jgi:hypothetical protein